MRSVAGDAQRLERLALAGGGVADEEHGGAAAVVERQARVGAVERHDAAVHGGHVVQREHHLLEVAEVAEAVLQRDRRHQQAAAAVVVEHGGQVAEAGERRRRDAVEVHGVGAGGDLLVRGDLEQVGEAQAEPHEAAVEVDEHGQATHERRVAEPLLALQLEPVERVVLHLGELPGARVHRRVEQQRRVEEQIADEGDAGEQLAVASRHRPLVAHGVHTDLGAGRDLAQHARPGAGDVLGDVAVQRADQPRERLDGLGEAAQRALVARRRRHLRAHHEEPVPAAPEVVQALDELVQLLAARKQVAGRARRDRRRARAGCWPAGGSGRAAARGEGRSRSPRPARPSPARTGQARRAPAGCAPRGGRRRGPARARTSSSRRAPGCWRTRSPPSTSPPGGRRGPVAAGTSCSPGSRGLAGAAPGEPGDYHRRGRLSAALRRSRRPPPGRAARTRSGRTCAPCAGSR